MTSIDYTFYLPEDVTFNIEDVKEKLPPLKVLMCNPQYFDIVDVKNIHMEKQHVEVDKRRAQKQWEELFQIYTLLKLSGELEKVDQLDPQPKLEDMVFAANQTFPWAIQKNQKRCIQSQMKHPNRQKEVAFYVSFFKEIRYKVPKVNEGKFFLEGMGDMIPMPKRNLIFGGYGFRTEKDVYQEIAGCLKVPIIGLKLIDERFYHLDTCFIPLSKEHVLIYEQAFDQASLDIIYELFDKVWTIPENEAINFALNAHAFETATGKKVAILHKDNPLTELVLKQIGYSVHLVDTSEYIKSGGSVFCMKLMYY